MIQNEVLGLCQLCISDTNAGPETALTLTITKEFSWNVHYRQHLVDSKCCIVLKNMPSLLNSGNFIEHKLNFNVRVINHLSIQSNTPY